MYSPSNIDRVNTQNLAPIVDEQWIKYNPSHTQYKGQRLVHHHINHGKFAVAIPQDAHIEYSKYIHFITRAESSLTVGEKQAVIRQKIRGMNRTLGVMGVFVDVVSSSAGNPMNFWNRYGKPPTLGSLMYVYDDLEPEDGYNYTHVYGKAEWDNGSNGYHEGWAAVYYCNLYVDYGWDELNSRYVGLGLFARGYTIVYKDGRPNIFKLIDCWNDCEVCKEFNKNKG
jgi:hypothetical protein